MGMPTPSEPLHLLWIGHSHLRCVRAAADEGAAALQAQGVQIDVLVLNQPQYEPHFTPAIAGGAPGALHLALQEELLQRSAVADAVVLSIGGNAHSAFGLVEHPRPWDFVSEAEPATPLLPGREPVPGAMVRASFAATDLFRHQSALRRFLPKVLQRPLVHVESPPPPRHEQHLLRHGGFYTEQIAARGVAPAELRRKLWRLHSHLVALDCDAADIEFIRAPAAVVDAEGFIRPAGLADDPTHASPWYGRRLIEQVVRRHRPVFALADLT